MEQLAVLMARLEALETRCNTVTQTLEHTRTENARLAAIITNQNQINTNLETKLNEVKSGLGIVPNIPVLEEIRTTYTDGSEIQLDAFKSLPIFNGDQSNYRSWREEASRLMDSIKNFKTHSKYAAALTIVKSKIQGAAANVLTNYNTIFNFEAIRNRLDYTYSNQEPLYVLQDMMKAITQKRSTLSEYHDEINKNLNLIISKITMSGDPPNIIDRLIKNANDDAVRIFIDGMSDNFTRGSLYSATINDLEHAFAIARRIEHDNVHRHLHLTQDKHHKNMPHERRNERRPNYSSQTTNYQPQKQYDNMQQHNQGPRLNPFKRNDGPQPMEINSRQIVHAQRQNWNQYKPDVYNPPAKREHSGSFNTHNRPQRSYQQNFKQQRVNNSRQQRRDDVSSTYAEADETECMVNNNIRIDHLN